jgi:hypothetical protein
LAFATFRACFAFFSFWNPPASISQLREA